MMFEMLREAAESRMNMGSGSPDARLGSAYAERGVAQEWKNRGLGKFGQHAGLSTGVGADATPVWTARARLATRRIGGTRYGYGVRRGGFRGMVGI